MRTALVTGGAGFIGSHLVDRLLEDGWRIKVVDNMVCGRLENLGHQSKNERLEIVEGDLRDEALMSKLVQGCDAVFHLAAHANIRKSLVDHKADLDNNVVGTINLLDAMVKHGVNDMVFASTSAVYGMAEILPTPEGYAPTQTSLYGASKLACESYAEAYTLFSSINFWAYRFSNVIGERCRRGVVWDFTHKLLSNPKELEILGDGKQSKEYLYVKDCIDGIILGYEKASERINIFNLGLDTQTTVDQVSDIVIDEMKLSGVKRKYTGGSSGWIGDNPIVILDMGRLSGLGWKPDLSSEEAIRRTTQWTLKNP